MQPDARGRARTHGAYGSARADIIGAAGTVGIGHHHQQQPASSHHLAKLCMHSHELVLCARRFGAFCGGWWRWSFGQKHWTARTTTQPGVASYIFVSVCVYVRARHEPTENIILCAGVPVRVYVCA